MSAEKEKKLETPPQRMQDLQEQWMKLGSETLKKLVLIRNIIVILDKETETIEQNKNRMM